MNIPVLVLLVVVLDTIIFGTLAYVLIKRSKKLQDTGQLPELAEALGIELHGGELRFPGVTWLSFLRSPYFLTGTIDGYNINIHSYVVSSGKHSTRYVRVSLARPVNYPLTFSIAREHIFSKIGKVMGHHDLETGNNVFDSQFLIRSSDEMFASSILLPEIQELLIAFDTQHSLNGALKLDEQGLRYDEIGSLNNEKSLAKIKPMVAIQLALAQACDAYLDLQA